MSHGRLFDDEPPASKVPAHHPGERWRLAGDGFYVTTGRDGSRWGLNTHSGRVVRLKGA